MHQSLNSSLQHSPPSKAIEHSVKRVHFKVSVSKAVLENDHPVLVPIWYGWNKDETSESLLPVTLPESAAHAPLNVITVIRFGCATDQPCSNDSCMC